MRQMIPPGPVVGLVAVVGLLGAVDHGVALGATGWLTGVGAGVAVTLLLARGLVERGALALGPADRVTLARAVLVCGVAALVAGATRDRGPTSSAALLLLVGLASVALSLDAVDGRVARRTGTVSPLGARFDLEVDAFLILVLSIHVAREYGWWVLAVGGWRYALLAAATWAPWLRGQLPARQWRKVVAAVQGIVLTVAAGHVLAHTVTTAALIGGLTLLTTSFGTETGALWRLTRLGPHQGQEPTAPMPRRGSRPPLRAGADQWPA